MAFFRNTTVNLLNLHYGIHALAITGGGAFFLVYLLRAGLPPTLVLASMAAITAGRFVFRPSILALGKRIGLRPLVLIGVAITALEYALLAEVHGVGLGLLALIVTSAVGETFYWTSYHAYFAALGDAEHRGQQIGVREAIAAIVGIVAPLAAGWTLTTLGPRVAFGVTGAILLLSALPLLQAPKVPIPREAPGALKASMGGAIMMSADGWMASGYFVWQIALFLSLGENFAAYGGAMALAALAGATAGLALGRVIDAGHGRRVAIIAFIAMSVSVAFRAVGYQHPAIAVIANAAGAAIVPFYTAVFMTAVYNKALASPCTLRFHIATEGGWDAGTTLGCLTAALLLWLGAPLWAGILLSLLGACAAYALMRRYYGREASARP